MLASNQAVAYFLQQMAEEALRQLEGVPTGDLNNWRPALPMNDVNTFYGLTTHLVGAGEFWILEAAGGREQHRQRLAEFVAAGTYDDLAERFQRWLHDANDVLGSLTAADMERMFIRPADPAQGLRSVEWTIAQCVTHGLEHSAVHVGHLQLQRQIYDAMMTP